MKQNKPYANTKIDMLLEQVEKSVVTK